MSSRVQAAFAALVGLLSGLYQALDDGGVTQQEWVGVVLAAVIAGGTGLGLKPAQQRIQRARMNHR